jgi:hypothetical protein
MSRLRPALFVALIVFVCLPAISTRAQSASNTETSVTLPPADLSSAPSTFSSAHPVDLVPSLSTGKPSTGSANARDTKFDIFLGYSYLSNDTAEFRAGVHGWNLNATWFLNNHIGMMADLSGHSGSNNSFGEDQDIDQYYYLFGPSFTQRIGDFAVSAHFAAGFAHQRFTYIGGPSITSAKENDFAMEAGGSFDWLGKGHWGWRIVKFDYLFSELQARSVNNVRISTGLIISFK